MDGLRNGKAILTHPTSAKGYDLFHNKDYFKQYHSVEDFMEKLDYLLNNQLILSVSKQTMRNIFHSQVDWKGLK